jgi:YD repeat-containing protein
MSHAFGRCRTIFGRLSVLLCLAACCLAAHAQLTSYSDVRKPDFAYRLGAAGPGMPNIAMFYQTPEEAWAPWVARNADACAINGADSPSCETLSPLRQCTDADAAVGAGMPHYFIWNIVSAWCYDYSYFVGYGGNSSGGTRQAGTSSLVFTQAICPDGYTPSGYHVVSGTGQAGDPYYYDEYCYKPLPAPSRNACGKGNSIYPVLGTKRQFEIDYQSANALLEFTRIYDSSNGGFTSRFDVDFAAPVPKLVLPNACLNGVATLTDPNVASGYDRFQKCFPELNYAGTAATFTGTDRAREDFTGSGSVWSPSANYFKDRLGSVVVNGTSYWMLSRRDEGEVVLFDASGKFARRQSINGPSVSATYAPGNGALSAVTDNFGRTIVVNNVVDLSGHPQLNSIVDPAGSVINYAYAGRQMTGVTYPDTFGKTYLWDEAAQSTGTTPGVNRLTGILDEAGIRYATFGYLNGAAVSTEHAVGVAKYTVSDSRDPSTGAGTLVVTYPSGAPYSSTYALVNGFSRETANTQPPGSGCSAATSERTYDTNGNTASVVDLDGHLTCYADDLSTNFEKVRVEGLTSGGTCSTYTAPAATLPAGSRKISTQWHPDWRLPTKVAEPGRITTYSYNGQGASCAPATATLPDGKPIAVLCSKTEQATTDADGSKDFSAVAQSGVAIRQWTYTYNQYGQVLTAKGPRTDLDDTTTYAYYADTSFTGSDPSAAGHTMGDLHTVTNSLGKVTSYTSYNKHGQVLQVVDANNVTTDFTYDLRQRLKSVSPGGQATTYDYWPTGLLKRVTQPSTTSYVDYGYDDAHRLTSITDNLGNRIDYTLDNAGNRTAENVKDPNGALTRQLSRVPDGLGRIQQTTGRE